MDCNAYRCAHNLPTQELLDTCDRLGMLVMDENHRLSSVLEDLADLRSLVRRDRNHPCTISGVISQRSMLGTADHGTKPSPRMVGNGNPSSHEADHAKQRCASHGYCQVILQGVMSLAGFL